MRKELICRRKSDRIQVVRLTGLTALIEYRPSAPHFVKLSAAIDRDGLINPVVAYRMTTADWAERCEQHRCSRSIEPKVNADGFIHGVKFGNQRLQYASSAGYTHISAAIFDTLEEALAWKTHLAAESRSSTGSEL